MNTQPIHIPKHSLANQAPRQRFKRNGKLRRHRLQEARARREQANEVPSDRRRLRDLLRGATTSQVILFLYLFLDIFKLGTSYDSMLTIGLLGIYAVSVLALEIIPNEVGKRRRVFTSMSIWIVAFWGFALLSLVWSPVSLDGTYAYRALQAIIVIPSVAFAINSRDDLYRYLAIFMLAAICMTIAQFAVTSPSQWFSGRLGDTNSNNHNTVGIYAALGCFVSFFLYMSKISRWHLIFIIPMAYLAMATGSRKAFFILIALLAVYAVISTRGAKGLVAVALVLAAIVLVFIFIMTNDVVYQVLGARVEHFIDSLQTGTSDEHSISQRAWYRQYAMQMFTWHPLIGNGLNSFENQMVLINYSHVAYSHCNYTELLCCFGIVGFLLYYWPYAVILGCVVSGRASLHNPLIAFATTTIIALLICDYGQVAFVMTYAPFFVCLAWCAFRIGIAEGKRDGDSVKATS